MEDDLKKIQYISLREAKKYCNYSQDYLKLRARQGKLKSVKFGRNWTTTKEWIEEYLNKTEEYNNGVIEKRNSTRKISKTIPNVEYLKPSVRLQKSALELQNSSRISVRRPIAFLPPVEIPIEKKPALRFGFAMTFACAILLAGGFFTMSSPKDNNIISFVQEFDVKRLLADAGTSSVGFFEKLKSQISDIKSDYLSANDFLENKISDFLFVTTPPSLQQAVSSKELDSVKKEIQDLKENGLTVKEITKEVSRITQIQPIKEITYEKIISRIETGSLANINASIADLQTEMSKRLYAPGGVITQQIYVTEPVSSPKIYQQDGDIVLQTAGSGNVILSAATGVQISGKMITLDSSDTLTPLIYIADDTKIDGDVEIKGSMSLGDILNAQRILLNVASNFTGNIVDIQSGGVSRFTITNNGPIAFTGGLAITGNITDIGIVNISSTTSETILTVEQDGTGSVVDFKNATGSVFTIINNGNVGIGTTTPAYLLTVALAPGVATSTYALAVHGSIEYTGALTAVATGLDVAERYSINSECEENNNCPEVGDVVSISENLVVEKSQTSYDKKLIGIVSDNPAIILQGNLNATNSRMVALVGRVPVNVSTENGAIEVGDALTSASSTPGTAMLATGSGKVIGTALEAYNGEEIGQILVFANVSWQGDDLTVQENAEGQLVMSELQHELADLGLVVNEFGILEVQELKTNIIITEQIEIKDKATGEIYCTWIEYGEWTKAKGKCSDLNKSPTVQITSHSVEAWPQQSTSTEAVFTFSASDSLATFQCKINSLDYESCTSPKTYPGLIPGEYTFQLIATNDFGSSDPASSTFSWTISEPAPEPDPATTTEE